MQLVDVFRARVVDVATDSLIVEITGTEDKIDGLVDVLRPYGVLEMVRTGRVAMSAAGTARPSPTSRRCRRERRPNGHAGLRFVLRVTVYGLRSTVWGSGLRSSVLRSTFSVPF